MSRSAKWKLHSLNDSVLAMRCIDSDIFTGENCYYFEYKVEKLLIVSYLKLWKTSECIKGNF